MIILVIGNGFDIAHGLPTKYGDFLTFICCFTELYNNVGGNMDADVRQNLMEFKSNDNDLYEEMYSLVIDNIWIRYFQSIADKMRQKGKENWIDFETEISGVIQAFDAVRHSVEKQYIEGNRKVEMENGKNMF